MFDAAVSRMVAGVVNLSSAHPVALCLILAVLAGAVSAVWLDLLGVRLAVPPRVGAAERERRRA